MQVSKEKINHSEEIERELEEEVEVLALTRQVEDCKRQLTSLLNIWYRYQTESKQKLMFEYDSLFGNLEDEIYDKNLTAETLEHKYNLLTYKIKNKEKITQKHIEFIDELLENERLQKIKNDRRKTSHKLYQARFSKRQVEFSSQIKFNDQYDISALYKLVVRQLHPDLVESSFEQQILWHNLQNCYKQQDLERIIMFYLLLCHDTRFDFNNIPIILEEFITELKDCINTQRQTIENLKTQEPFCFDGKLDDKNWIESHKNNLRQALMESTRRIIKTRQLINKIKIEK